MVCTLLSALQLEQIKHNRKYSSLVHGTHGILCQLLYAWWPCPGMQYKNATAQEDQENFLQEYSLYCTTT
jgi:hypothetical protein